MIEGQRSVLKYSSEQVISEEKSPPPPPTQVMIGKKHHLINLTDSARNTVSEQTEKMQESTQLDRYWCTPTTTLPNFMDFKEPIQKANVLASVVFLCFARRFFVFDVDVYV